MTDSERYTLEELSADYDWGEAFGDKSSGNTTKDTTAVPPGVIMDITPPCRSDVAEIIATSDGEHEGPPWVGLFLLKDGRFLAVEAGCDYTGWD